MADAKPAVAVVYGGPSEEREVSLESRAPGFYDRLRVQVVLADHVVGMTAVEDDGDVPRLLREISEQ